MSKMAKITRVYKDMATATSRTGGYTKLNNETNWWLLNHLKDSGHKATETAAKLNIMYSAPESEKVEIWKNMFSEGGKQKWH